MKKILLKENIEVNVPVIKKENNSPSFSAIDEYKEAFNYYKANGYVIIRDILKKEEANNIVSGWNTEIKNYKGYLVRQSSHVPQKNKFNDKNWVMNSLQHIQNLPPKEFPKLTSSFMDYLCENKKLADLIKFFIKGKPRLVQSMFFEGNTTTEAHYDSFYLDDEIIGRMAGCWIALEDIDWNAGRFFVCPKSHLNKKFHKSQAQQLIKDGLGFDQFIENNYEAIRNNNYEVRAPFLSKGEILVWNSLTIHGSLKDINPKNSRKSITMHFTRTNTKFRQSFSNQLVELSVEEREFIDIHRIFSYTSFFKLSMLMEAKFPRIKAMIKKIISFSGK